MNAALAKDRFNENEMVLSLRQGGAAMSDEILHTGYGRYVALPHSGPGGPTDAELAAGGSWVPGGYGGPCRQCGGQFMAAKRVRI